MIHQKRVREWDFLVPQQYIMMDTFSRPLCNFLRFYVNSVNFAYFLKDFFAFFQSKQIRSTTNFPYAEMGINIVEHPKKEAKKVFQASVLFLLWFETVVAF